MWPIKNKIMEINYKNKFARKIFVDERTTSIYIYTILMLKFIDTIPYVFLCFVKMILVSINYTIANAFHMLQYF